MGEWHYCLTFIVFLGVLFFTSAVLALLWAVKKGYLANFEEQARSIFDDEEPEGVCTDAFKENKD
jgi:nitrogen fixation-related uncharacterized protein